jgi:hypothetical protein
MQQLDNPEFVSGASKKNSGGKAPKPVLDEARDAVRAAEHKPSRSALKKQRRKQAAAKMKAENAQLKQPNFSLAATESKEPVSEVKDSESQDEDEHASDSDEPASYPAIPLSSKKRPSAKHLFEQADKYGGVEAYYVTAIKSDLKDARNKRELQFLCWFADLLRAELALSEDHEAAKVLVARMHALRRFDATKNVQYFNVLTPTSGSFVSPDEETEVDQATAQQGSVISRVSKQAKQKAPWGKQKKFSTAKDNGPGGKTGPGKSG